MFRRIKTNQSKGGKKSQKSSIVTGRSFERRARSLYLFMPIGSEYQRVMGCMGADASMADSKDPVLKLATGPLIVDVPSGKTSTGSFSS